MDRIKRTRPSPALIVAALALIAAFAGSALADQATTTKRKGLTKKERGEVKQIAKKKANQQIGKKAPGLSVASAENAANATNAANADQVDGRHASCPTGMTAIAGLCYDAASRADDDWNDARADCADENASLPTIGQLQLAIDELGNLDGGGEWTDSFHYDGSADRAGVLTSDGNVLGVLDGSLDAYRCVRPLVR